MSFRHPVDIDPGGREPPFCHKKRKNQETESKHDRDHHKSADSPTDIRERLLKTDVFNSLLFLFLRQRLTIFDK